jgi:hypothetical protein
MVESEPPRGAAPADDDAAIAAAKAKAAEAVRAAYARDPEAPTRRCNACGAEARTRFEQCPTCGTSYFARPPRLSRRARWVLGGALVVLAAAALAILVPRIDESKRDRAVAERAATRAQLAAQRVRLVAEQRPHRGRGDTRDDLTAGAAERLAARAALVRDVEAAITGDARARVAAGRLSGRVRETQCGQGRRDLTRDDRDLSKRIGRYDCVAVTGDATRDGASVAAFGVPFVAAVDFRRGTYVWCKNNPAPGEGGRALLTVRLDPACLGLPPDAEPLGNGYVMPQE